MKLSVIIATKNEEATIYKTLEALARLVNVDEVVISDGGSTDATLQLVRDYNISKDLKIIESPSAVHAELLNRGAQNSNGDALWFLAADARPMQGSGRQIKHYLRFEEVVGGNFEVIFTSNESRWARFLTRMYPELRKSGLVYGDSAPFVRRKTFDEIGGFRDFPEFEYIDLHKRLTKKGRFVHVPLAVRVSAKRFADKGYTRSFLRWSLVQGLYWFGVPARFLAKLYRSKH